MKKQNKSKIQFVFTSILYSSGFLLFLEWMYPLEQMNPSISINIFIIFTMFSFAISFFRLPGFVSFLLKTFGMLFIIHALYFEVSFFNVFWVKELLSEITYNFQMLFTKQWYAFTPIFRSTLFLILIWLMSYLIHYWFIYVRRFLLFIVLTFIYLTVLDAFTAYDTNIAIIRTFIISLIALGVANFLKETEMEEVAPKSWQKNVIWFVPLILFVLFSSLIGYAAPKNVAQWQDPVPFFEELATNNGIGKSTAKKSGYSEDDTQLGGSFNKDFTPVFRATVQKEHYWRIESKDIYTGKGWKKSEQGNFVELSKLSLPENVETNPFDAVITFQDEMRLPKLVYPYGINQLTTEEPNNFMIDVYSGDLFLENGRANKIEKYSITYNYPSFSIDRLRESVRESEQFRRHYTQLPEQLPARIKDLAEDITAPYNNRYDKVKAIEQYFNQNGFKYQLSNVPIPGEEQDYVDQFLFDSKVGYCDNFSTAMVVMLRSIGIPAQWVKGFTSGEKMDAVNRNGKSYEVYEVTNENAHSWVEVYFHDVGWVPFEPTQGFSNLTDFYENVDEEMKEEESEQVEEADTVIDESQVEIEQNELTPEEEQATMKQTNTEEKNESNVWRKVKHFLLYALIIFILVTTIILYRKRLEVETYFVEKRWLQKRDAQAFQDAYHHLLKVLNQSGEGKKPDQTLREYAKQIDGIYHTDLMRRLTNIYEQVLYRNDTNATVHKESTQLWKNLIRRIIG